MNLFVLALLGLGSVAVLARARPTQEGTDSSSSFSLASAGQDPPAGTVVVCPSRLPGTPIYADPLTAYGEWTAPCDVQKVAEQPPPPFYEGCPDGGCKVLPDGTPLYEYSPDGLTSTSAWDTFAPDQPKVVQTWFAGVPLDYPPLLPTGMPAYTYVPQPNKAVAAGIATTFHDSSVAPYAWRQNNASALSPATYYDKQIDEVFAGMNKVRPSGENLFTPISQFPPPPKKDALGGFINSISEFACTALAGGLAIGGPSVELLGLTAKAAKKKDGKESTIQTISKLGTNFYQSLCGDS